MAKETNFPEPPRGHIALLGWDSVNARWQAVAVDASGLIQVDVADAIALQANAHGYDGSAWRKLQQLWGYTARWVERKLNANADVGTNDLLSGAVPAGYVYIMNLADCYNSTSVCLRVISATNGSIYPSLVNESAIAAGVITLTGFCRVVLEEGDQVRARFVGCTAGDSLGFRIWGYKMKIDD